MKVSAVIVTRGDVDLIPVLESLPPEWEQVVWDNGTRRVARRDGKSIEVQEIERDVAVYGRYAAIEYATGDVIYVQDDDVIVSDPWAIVHQWLVPTALRQDHVVCNMPPEFRHEFYQEHALVGFGAAFHRDAPARAWLKMPPLFVGQDNEWFCRTCDVVFTALTPRFLVDVPKTNLPWAEAENRMYKQQRHQGERSTMLELVKKIQARAA